MCGFNYKMNDRIDEIQRFQNINGEHSSLFRKRTVPQYVQRNHELIALLNERFFSNLINK